MEQVAKEIVDMLVANGAIPPQGRPADWQPNPPSYEGAYLVVLEVLKRGSNATSQAP